MSLASKEAAIQVTDLEGNRETVVTGFAGIGNLNWSPDGDSIAFWAYRSTDCVYECTEVYVVNLSDRSMKCLTEQYEINPLFNVVWSPDGSRIAFTALPGPNLYTLVPNGENLVRVAPMDAPDLVWSPDGKWIAFERGTTEGEKNRIWLAQMEQGDLRELETP
jgi:Tol biopolymer transport system component